VRFIYIVFSLALLTLSAAAQDKKVPAAQSTASVLINGKPIQGTVLEADGKHFVAIEDLAQALNGTIAYSEGRVALTLLPPPPAAAQASSLPSPPIVAAEPTSPPPPTTATAPISPNPSMAAQAPSSPTPSAATQAPAPPPASLPVQPSASGGIKGKLTYFFDFHTGNKPDAGSKVWLVKGRVEIPEDQDFVGTSTALGSSKNPDQYAAIKYAIASENGTFELLNVPADEYTLILQSAHTKGALGGKRSFFNRGTGHTLRDSNGRVESLNVVVKAGETANASKDFGPDAEP
jgi:hypothetical protein